MEDSLISSRKRINLLKIPVDAVSGEDVEKIVEMLLEDGKAHHIMLVSLKDLLRARFNTELRNNMESAALVLPISESICKGAGMLKREHIPELYFPFDFVLKLLGIIEKKGKTVYLAGGKRAVLQITESNIRTSYPGMNLVGRCTGFFPKEMEKNIITAIKKSSPALLLAGSGLPGGRYWITRNKAFFNPGISLWIGKSFDIFAGKRKRPAKTTGGRLGEKLEKVFKNPLRIFNLFVYFWYYLLIMIYKIRKI